jgi:AmmeMemoRadiSam system protein B
MRRNPYVAGSFYPARKDLLAGMIEGMADPEAVAVKALAVVAPHAGYEYSGPVAAAVFSSVLIPETCLILGPGHRDIGSLFAVQKEGSWVTPLGEARVSTALSSLVMKHCPRVEDNPEAHLREHSLEVEVPFLQFFRSRVQIVPICVSYEAGFDDLEDLGRGLAAAVGEFGGEVLIVASTDMSHYVSQKAAERKDGEAIRRVLALDPRGLFDTVREKGITMCGYQPTTAALVAAIGLGAARAELIKYQTSGDRTGDFSEVVGYAGIRIVASPAT